MSRIRIVKGKITENIGENLSFFSQKNIVESSSSFYSENSEIGINYGSNPENAPIPQTITQCAIYFRPTKGWRGEFGFDWLRIGDSKLEVDKAYDKIVGNYGLIYATVEGSKFTYNQKKYSEILTEYEVFNVYTGKYYVPNMTLREGEKAVLDAIVHVRESR